MNLVSVTFFVALAAVACATPATKKYDSARLLDLAKVRA